MKKSKGGFSLIKVNAAVVNKISEILLVHPKPEKDIVLSKKKNPLNMLIAIPKYV